MGWGVKSAFIKDSLVAPYDAGSALKDYSVEELDPKEFTRGVAAELTVGEFQREMFDANSSKDIRREHCMIVAPDGEILVANRGNEFSCGFTGKQMDDHAKGNYIVHNHPPVQEWKGDAGTFSGTDIASMGKGEAGSIVSAPEGQYIMEFTPDSDIEGFKREMNDRKYDINKALIAMRIKAAQDWYNKQYAKGFDDDETRASAIRRSQNQQKAYWDKQIHEVAMKHGLVYRFEKNDTRLVSKSLYVDESDALSRGRRGARSSESVRASTNIRESCILDYEGTPHAYVETKDNKMCLVPLDGPGEVLPGGYAYKAKKNAKTLSWMAIARAPKG